MDFPLPPVGEGLIEVELVRWLVRPGDAVSRGQGLAEVMSDKATMEVPAPFAGTISALAATPGTKVKVGQLFLRYEPVGDVAATPAPARAGARASGPQMGEASGAGNGARPSRPVEVERAGGPRSSPTNGPAPRPGIRRRRRRRCGCSRASSASISPAFAAPGRAGASWSRTSRPICAPRPGRPTIPCRAPGPTPPSSTSASPARAASSSACAGCIAEHMVEAKHKIPHYSYIDECDLTDLVRLRSQLRDPLAKAGVKLTYLAFFVKAVARALKDVPIVNSTFDEAAGEVVLHDHYHIGVAVAAPNGLIVPVVKDADKKDLLAIAQEIDRLSTDAKAGQEQARRPEGRHVHGHVDRRHRRADLDADHQPPARSASWASGKVVKRPLYDANGDLKPHDIVYLSFSFDHRIVDGAVGAAFGNAVVRYLQAPALLLLPERCGGGRSAARRRRGTSPRDSRVPDGDRAGWRRLANPCPPGSDIRRPPVPQASRLPAVVAALLLFAFALFQALGTNNLRDFFIFRLGAELAVRGENPYDVPRVRGHIAAQYPGRGREGVRQQLGYFLPPLALVVFAAVRGAAVDGREGRCGRWTSACWATSSPGCR